MKTQLSLFFLYTSTFMFSQVSLLKDLNPGSGDGFPINYGDYNGKVYFSANKTTSSPFTCDIWQSDGTTAGTVLLKQISYTSSSYPAVNSIIQEGANMYFIANTKLYVSDGTSAGTMQTVINSVSSPLISMNGKVYCSGYHFSTGNELYVYDISNNSFTLVSDILSGTNSSNLNLIGKINGKILFSANDGVSGIELWASDGTATGTTLLMDINPGSGDAFPGEFVIANGKCYFTAYNGTEYQMWQTDGTPTGTTMLAPGLIGLRAVSSTHALIAYNFSLISVDLQNGDTTLLASPINIPLSDNFCAVGNKFYFSVLPPSTPVCEIWVSDATVNGTYSIAPWGGSVNVFTPIGNSVFFTLQSQGGVFYINTTANDIDTVDMTLNGISHMYHFNNNLYISGYSGFNSAGSEVYIYNTGITGLNTIENKPVFKIFPNPATDVIKVAPPEQIKYSVFRLCDITGKIHSQGKLEPEIDLSDLHPGMYILTITDEKGNSSFSRVIKE